MRLSITLHCDTHHTRRDCTAVYTVPCLDNPGQHGMSDAASQLVLDSQRDGWDLRPMGVTGGGVKTIALCPNCASALLDEEEPSTGKPSASGPPSSGLPHASPSAPSASLSDAPPAPLTSSAPNAAAPPSKDRLPSDLRSNCAHRRWEHGPHTCTVIPCLCRRFREAPVGGCMDKACPDLSSPWAKGEGVQDHEHDKGEWITGIKRQEGYRMLVRFCRLGGCTWHEHWESRGW